MQPLISSIRQACDCLVRLGNKVLLSSLKDMSELQIVPSIAYTVYECPNEQDGCANQCSLQQEQPLGAAPSQLIQSCTGHDINEMSLASRVHISFRVVQVACVLCP